MDISSEINILSLCAGGGGLELGVRLLIPSARVCCYVEREAYAAAILAARMEDGALDQAPIWSDLATFDGKPWCRKIHIITAGFPCQPFSVAGKGLSLADSRWLWPEVRRVVEEVSPLFVFCENVEPILKRGLSVVVKDLYDMGYGVAADIFTAQEVGAPHSRKRLFMLGYAKGGRDGSGKSEARCKEPNREPRGIVGNRDDTEADASFGLPLFPPGKEAYDEWASSLMQFAAPEPCIPRMADELASRMEQPNNNIAHRHRILGNGVVPACAAYALGILLGRVATEVEE